MDHVPIANLEAELGYLTGPFLHAAPRRDHGASHASFDVPSTSTSSLPWHSDNRSVNTFGNDGNIAWATPNGELLQLAKCIDNRIVCAEFAGSVERGRSYVSRAKALNRSLCKPPSSGLGIGISLKFPMDLSKMSWLHNRWPRFCFQADFLAVHLQYYTDAQSVVQDFQIRNNGHEPISVPFTFSSDICFREHDRKETSAIHPISARQCWERQLLFGNSEVMVQDEAMGCRMSMALFFNGQKQCLWQPKPSRSNHHGASNSGVSKSPIPESDKLQKVEEKLRDMIMAGNFVDDVTESELRGFYRKYNDHKSRIGRPDGHDEHNFARSSHHITVPPESTQELRVIMRLSSLTRTRAHSKEAQSQAPQSPQTISRRTDSGQNIDMDHAGLKGAQTRPRVTLAKARRLSPRPREPRSRQLVSNLNKDNLELGEALKDLGRIGEARYHLFTYCLLTEYIFPEPLMLGRARLRYAKFLDDYGWQASALQILEQLNQDLSQASQNQALLNQDLLSQASRNQALYELKEEVQFQLASTYLAQGDFSRAESLYFPTLNHSALSSPMVAQYMERAARAQVRQGKLDEADSIYTSLLELPNIRRRSLLTNLGFIKRQLGNAEEARGYYERAIKECVSNFDCNDVSVERHIALSGLFACFHTLGANPDADSEVAAALIDYPGVIFPATCATHLKMPIKEGPFHFAISRQLESLLSTCSVSVTNPEGFSGVAFLDADPLGCVHHGRTA
ncbi:MAG: hypothetical protein Q9183_002085 [Haloplaca sp. 2 TL-2023]